MTIARPDRLVLFERDEYDVRLMKVRRAMADRGIDTLILSDPCNLFYLSGYDAWSFYTPQYLIVPGNGDAPVWLGRGIDRKGAAITTWLADDDIVAYPDDHVQAVDKHPAQPLCALLAARGWARGVVGLEASSYYLTATAWAICERELPAARLVDASLLVNRVRLVKSPAEIAYMQQSARIVEGAMTVATEGARAGIRENELAADIYRALIAGTATAGGTYSSSPPFMPSGGWVDTPHLSWRDRRYERGEQVNFELMACHHRYHVPMSRTVWIGAPPARLLALEAVAVEALNAALDAVRPGVRACDVEAAWQAVARRGGIRKASRCGYSIGIAYPPTMGELTVSLRPGDETILEEGMTLHLMPGVWHEGSSIVITEAFRVTARGAERFCGFPQRLFVND